MTRRHLLLETSRTSPVTASDIAPAGGKYDVEMGAWVDKTSGRLLIESPDREPPRTKKCDVETGEDQKRE